MSFTRCSYCGYMYDEWNGDSRNGVPAGISMTALAGTVCSRCGIQGLRHERQPGPKYEEAEAQYYDQFAGKAGISFYRSWLDKSPQPARVLELGVGTGRLAAELAVLTERYVGMDWSPQMLKIAETKRKRIFKNEAEQRLRLVEQNALDFHAQETFTHVLCPDGFLQHFTLMEEHIALLSTLYDYLDHGGWIAVDVHLPPGGAGWKTRQRKQLQLNKWVSQIVEGETSLSRQLFRCTIDYETYLEGTMSSRYRIEREFALFTPKEIALLLASTGFEVTRAVWNFGLSEPWSTALPSGIKQTAASLGATEAIEEALAAGKSIQLYRQDIWGNGGYPFAGAMTAESSGAPATVTLIAQKQ
ncbi:methyltransferase domain-containing protein [Paenibacillus brevis]|uniref:Methyltransferase domain-containing protein n=1 Tax=Paenibacillus brevis TaxID=2841508 RepID=A0ABS6FSB7_9BACL|nr:methyltransferase domain-containing protein [Paenibacillus brevis]MBU5673137.1 methyltransferase domain-containing protein [Paenibacillus brevis]